MYRPEKSLPKFNNKQLGQTQNNLHLHEQYKILTHSALAIRAKARLHEKMGNLALTNSCNQLTISNIHKMSTCRLFEKFTATSRQRLGQPQNKEVSPKGHVQQQEAPVRTRPSCFAGNSLQCRGRQVLTGATLLPVTCCVAIMSSPEKSLPILNNKQLGTVVKCLKSFQLS